MTVGSESAPFESPKTPDGKQDVKKAVQGQGKTVEKQWKGSEKAPIIAVPEQQSDHVLPGHQHARDVQRAVEHSVLELSPGADSHPAVDRLTVHGDHGAARCRDVQYRPVDCRVL